MSIAIRAANDRLDYALSALMATIALVVSALLIADVNLFVGEASDRSERTQVARLSETAPGVRRRPRDLPVWDNARLAEPLYLKDFVFTDKDASAKLTFLDDSTIELGENTLVEVQQIEQNSVLNVIKGTLKAKAGAAEILIRVNGQKDLIRSKAGSALELNVEKGRPAQLTVFAGKAEVGEARVAVVANQGAALTGEASLPAIRQINLALSSPPHGAAFKDPLASGVELTWRGEGPSFRVELSRDQSFGRILRKEDVSRNTFLTGTLASGAYFWRIVSPSGETSEVRKFTVAVTRGPTPYRPADGQVVDDLSPRLTWEPLPDARSYQVEIATDAAFSQVVWHTKSKSPDTRAAALKEGSYYWRVSDEATGVWSVAARFAIKPELVAPVPAPLPKPKLDAPVLPKKFDIKLPWNDRRPSRWRWLKALVESTAFAGEDEKVLGWGAVEGAGSYLVELAEDAEFTRRVVSEKVPTAAWRVHGLAPGTYFLRVAGIDSEGVIGAFSEPSQVVVSKASVSLEEPDRAPEPKKTALASPLLIAPVHGEKVVLTGLLPVVSFSWKGVAGAATYMFQVAEDEDFKAVIYEKRTRGLDLGVELKPHVYHWRMRSLRSAEDPGPWSKAHRFEVIHTVPGKPEPADPPPTRLEPGPALAPLIPKLKPEHGRLTLAFTPSSYRYEAKGSDPETKIDARLFNSQSVHGFFSLRPGLALEGAFRRTSTVLFKDENDGDPPGQKPLKIAPYAGRAAVRWRLGDDLTPLAPFFDVAPGFESRGVIHFKRMNDQTLDAETKQVQGPVLTLAGGLRVDQELGFRMGVTGSPKGQAAFAILNWDFASPGLGFELGIESSKEETEVSVQMQTLILGLSYNY